MHKNRSSIYKWMVLAVLTHFLVSIVHGMVHMRARVPLSAIATVFVFAVILAGPWIGLALTVWASRFGTWLIALTMASALVFGLLNHFVFAGPDQVSQIDPQWRLLFTATAVLLALTEILASGLALWSVQRASG